ncbi:MAG: hypothetical protein AOA65_2214 [Candidatus Bathyarchaeota archaeon BA1]|nr:MAG: hypothetical protein AOA65_2214 [Candidatus Bathyarchaeota archaeon BA1]
MKNPTTASLGTVSSLKPCFEPRSVAVIGVSRSPEKAGSIIFRNLTELKFKGKVYPVNPKVHQIFSG